MAVKAIEYLTIDRFTALPVRRRRFHMMFGSAMGKIAEGVPVRAAKALHAPKYQTVDHAIATADARDRFHQEFRDLQRTDLRARHSDRSGITVSGATRRGQPRHVPCDQQPQETASIGKQMQPDAVRPRSPAKPDRHSLRQYLFRLGLIPFAKAAKLEENA